MTFELLPVVDTMLELYQKPLNPERFKAYLALLEGGKKGELNLPIGGFNPMAKPHVIEKLNELKLIDAEDIITKSLVRINKKTSLNYTEFTIKVALNLADDTAGGWTNKYTTDFDSKFKISALVKRSFCTPFFWTSESFTVELIRQRTEEYVYRTLYWLQNPKPKTLADYVKQETFVTHNTRRIETKIDEKTAKQRHDFYYQNAASEDYSLIFNYFYGDMASQSLGFSTFGL